jgi:uncharacterized membrane protein YphA (DoxX/SURF4 family)
MILVRLVVGLVFITEGILKFMRPDELGAGRFLSLGFPYPHQLAPIVGGVEIGAGLCVLSNFFAGDAAVILLIVILTALVTTKVPILLGHKLGSIGPVNIPTPYGVLTFLHEARTDLSMVFCTLAIIIDSGLRTGRRHPWYQSRGK